MSDESFLREMQRRARHLIVNTVYGSQAGHIGGPLSAVDLLIYLYFEYMVVDPGAPWLEGRDRFVLSKGHASIALYTVLALRGFFEVSELSSFDKAGSRLQGHPDITRGLPGIDASTGSLGQGLSVGAGMAYGMKLKGNNGGQVVVMLGDGELQEGQVWEAAEWVGQKRLTNLVVIVDMNGLSQFKWPSTFPSVESVSARWRALGWEVAIIDGHCFDDMRRKLRRDVERARPQAILAKTIKGKGVSFMEGQVAWHSRVPSIDEVVRANNEIRRF